MISHSICLTCGEGCLGLRDGMLGQTPLLCRADKVEAGAFDAYLEQAEAEKQRAIAQKQQAKAKKEHAQANAAAKEGDHFSADLLEYLQEACPDAAWEGCIAGPAADSAASQSPAEQRFARVDAQIPQSAGMSFAPGVSTPGLAASEEHAQAAAEEVDTFFAAALDDLQKASPNDAGQGGSQGPPAESAESQGTAEPQMAGVDAPTPQTASMTSAPGVSTPDLSASEEHARAQAAAEEVDTLFAAALNDLQEAFPDDAWEGCIAGPAAESAASQSPAERRIASVDAQIPQTAGMSSAAGVSTPDLSPSEEHARAQAAAEEVDTFFAAALDDSQEASPNNAGLGCITGPAAESVVSQSPAELHMAGINAETPQSAGMSSSAARWGRAHGSGASRPNLSGSMPVIAPLSQPPGRAPSSASLPEAPANGRTSCSGSAASSTLPSCEETPSRRDSTVSEGTATPSQASPDARSATHLPLEGAEPSGSMGVHPAPLQMTANAPDQVMCYPLLNIEAEEEEEVEHSQVATPHAVSSHPPTDSHGSPVRDTQHHRDVVSHPIEIHADEDVQPSTAPCCRKPVRLAVVAMARRHWQIYPAVVGMFPEGSLNTSSHEPPKA